jgi:hypothetical protein
VVRKAEAHALPGYFRNQLVRYCQGIIHFDPRFWYAEQKLNGPLATAGIESFRIAREAFKALEMSEGGRTIILIGLLRRCRPAS